MSEELLINLVEKHPAIWDRNHRHYTNKAVKLKHWRLITTKCSYTSVEECKAKWKALREKYRRELITEEKIQKSGDVPISRPNWYLMNSMAFLKDNITIRSASVNFDDSYLKLDNGILHDSTMLDIKSENASDLESLSENIDNDPRIKRRKVEDDANVDSFPEPELSIQLGEGFVDNFVSYSKSSDTNNSDYTKKDDSNFGVFLKGIAEAVNTIRSDGESETDRKISAFCSYLKEELRQFSKEACDSLINEIMLNVITAKRSKSQ